MKTYTKEEWEKFFEMNKEFYTRANAFVTEKTNFPRGYSINHIDVDHLNGRLEVEYDDSCFGNRSCDWEYFPIEYLWNENWRMALKEEMARERAERQRREDEQLRAAEEKKEQEDRTLYLKLKEKFGD
jgi:hypothetical protein